MNLLELFIRTIKSLADNQAEAIAITIINDKALVSKIMNLLNPKEVIKLFRTDFGRSMNFLTLLELLIPYINNELAEYLMKDYIRFAFKMLKDNELREFFRTLIYGPLARLNITTLINISKEIANLPCTLEGLLLKIDYLIMLTSTYPPREFLNNELVDAITLILSNICKDSLILVNDVDLAEIIYQGMNTILNNLNSICKELSNWSPCNSIIGSLDKLINKTYTSLSKLILKRLNSQS